MLFESKEFENKLANFGLDLTSMVSDQNNKNYNSDYQYKKYFNDNKMGTEFVSAKEGFLRGNLYKNEYKPYKNLTYFKIVPKTEKEAKFLPVYELDAALVDLNFHLDLHPEDQNAFNLFKTYVKEFKQAKDEYERLYGSICLTDTTGEVFDWVDNPWPWDKDGGSMYV